MAQHTESTADLSDSMPGAPGASDDMQRAGSSSYISEMPWGTSDQPETVSHGQGRPLLGIGVGGDSPNGALCLEGQRSSPTIPLGFPGHSLP